MTAYHGSALDNQVVAPIERGGIIFLSQQRTCHCGHVTMILVNRGGRTYCVICAPAAPKETK